MQLDLSSIDAAGVQVVGVSYDDVAILKTFSDEHEIGFPLLADQGSKTIRAFGIYNKDGLPHPGTILIDRNGVIRDKLFLDGYRDRHTNDALIAAAKKLGAAR